MKNQKKWNKKKLKKYNFLDKNKKIYIVRVVIHLKEIYLKVFLHL